MGPPSAQSRFASGRCYRLEEGICRLLEGRYPFVFAHTGSCARPVALRPASASPRAAGLCSLLSATAGHRPFPTLSLPILPRVSGPLLRLPHGCSRPLLPHRHWPPRVRTGSAHRFSPTATSVGTHFRSCSHSLIFRPIGLLATQVAPTSGFRPRQQWLLRPRLSRFVTSPCSGYAIRPNPGN